MTSFILIALISVQLTDRATHLLFVVDPEALLFSNAGQLDVLGVKLLLHHLFQCLQNKGLGLGEGERSVVFILQLSLGSFAAGADGLGIISIECSGRLGVISVKDL